MSKPSPTARSLALLRERGYLVEVVEKRLPRTFITKDAFGILDVIALRAGEVLGVQVTSASNHSSRRAKALAAPGLRAWLESGARFSIHSWGKCGPRGQRKRWECREQELMLTDIAAGERLNVSEASVRAVSNK
jgi:hypothetical protein